jgi:hypothetical protein
LTVKNDEALDVKMLLKLQAQSDPEPACDVSPQQVQLANAVALQAALPDSAGAPPMAN